VTSLRVRLENGERTLGPADFPVPLGGPGSVVPVAAAAGPIAWLGLEDGDVFVQPSPGAMVHCNGTRLQASHWLRHGDTLRLAGTPVDVHRRADGLELRVGAPGEVNPTEPPVVLVPPPRGASRDDSGDEELVIEPIPYTPRVVGREQVLRTWRPPDWLLPLAGVLAFVAALGLVVSRLALVEVVVEPTPDRVALQGRWPALKLRSHRLTVAGSHTLTAEKAGYRRLEETVEVQSGLVIRRTLAPLPGRLAVETPGLAGAEVSVDGTPRGVTPLPAFEVDAGERELHVRAAGYEEHRARLAVKGLGELQSVVVTLKALPPPPPGPAPPPRPGVLVLSSEPPGARVSVAGAVRGRTPVELQLAPGTAHAVRASLPGHADAELSLTLRAGERREATLRLVPQLGEVKVAARPPDAELLVDGQPRGRADQTLSLVAVPHVLEFRREGYEPARVTITPRPGFPQTVSPALKSHEQKREEQMPAVAKSPEGHELRLFEGRRIQMGAPRREPGRRSNEQQRDVELVRRFYVATREVSNAQFRRYLQQHSSGSVSDETLDVDSQPVVNVTWEQAAAYCNWLSDREGLPRVYVERGAKLGPAAPLPKGYRLPTEAEWERVARYPGGEGPLKYPWGSALPVPPLAGNYADEQARSLVSRVLDGYEDGYRASAPVDSFKPNALGFFHLGDNVAEWAHDLYTLMPSAVGQLVRDPLGPAEGDQHVIRGASFLHGSVTELRLSYRDYGKDARPDVGFRVARYAE
jgi:formylglycine-generating enzyme required for sulfatase activity